MYLVGEWIPVRWHAASAGFEPLVLPVVDLRLWLTGVRRTDAPGKSLQLRIGGDPVRRLPAAVPETISVADQLRRSAFPPDILRQADDLLLALVAVECRVSADGPAQVPPALLRDLVILTGRLAGRTWLEARADTVAAFTGLQATWQPPPLPELDRILTRVLSERFGLPSPTAAAS